jgi:zinc protease
VVRQERREAVDNDASGQLDEALHQALYGTHPYGHPVLGTADDLDRLTRDDALQFFRKHYAPERLALVIAGGVDSEEALRLAVQHHGRLPGADAGGADEGREKPLAEAKLPQRGTTATVKLDAGAERLVVAWRTVPGKHGDQAALAVLADVLANAETARLTKLLVHDRGVASSVDAVAVAPRWTGFIDFHVVLRPGQKARAVEPLVCAAIDALRTQEPSAAEVDGARRRLLTDRWRETVTVDGRAEALGATLATFGSLDAYGRFWDSVATATPADIKRVAAAWLLPERRVIVRGEVEGPRVAHHGRKKAPS